MELQKDLLETNLWNHPNQLSEEMVKCMRNIFLCLSESSDISSKASSSEYLPSQSSPVDQLSFSFTSFSDSSLRPQTFCNPSTGTYKFDEIMDQVDTFDPYGVNGKVNWRNIGSYSLAAEVTWMSVGKAQLEYAAEALKGYRYDAQHSFHVIMPKCILHIYIDADTLCHIVSTHAGCCLCSPLIICSY